MINNYKIYYINQLNYIGEFISIPNLINLFDINPDDIICEYNNKEYKEIKILNCYEEAKKESRGLEGINNEKRNQRKLFIIIQYYFKYNVMNENIQ